MTVEHDTLRDALKVAHLDTGADLSAGEARRLACGAGIIPAVLGGTSLPLDLGRSSRLFSEAQRTALGLRHDTCAADGCERPYAWCELHHEEPWSHGGNTDLAQAIPLCHFHHRRIHDPHYEHVRARDGAVVFHQVSRQVWTACTATTEVLSDRGR
ncbi:HNH endonuclease signature motif containing protein [Marmoricola sp. RAF53]|uniref:HNH endonuclease signature motif containing protein n=1 Tax=Marmoricola sp. RAF53 TaxID=3233059 RepID=UPI003F9C9F00